MATIDGNNGSNLLIGGDSNDVIDGKNGNDLIYGGDGNDTILGGNGSDLLLGGDGDDSLDGGNGTDILCGGDGDDQLSGGNANDLLTGGEGDDAIDGGNGGHDTAIYLHTLASYQFQLLDGGAIQVTHIATGDTDTVTNVELFVFTDAILAADDLPFETVVDTADYSWTTLGVEVDLTANTATGPEISGGSETLAASIVNAIGGSGDDILRGDPGDNQLFGGDGNDLLIGGLGGNDLFDGGNGLDRVSFSGAANSVNVLLAAGTATIGVFTKTLQSIELVRGTNQNDTFDATGFAGFNEFEGLGGDDSITGNGNTRVSYFQATDGVNVNLATGTGTGLAVGDVANVGTDTFTGVNAVRGSEFDDELRGSAADETFIGGAGNDFFGGGGGNDTFNGGAGFDTASYGMASGSITGDLAAGTVITGPETDLLNSIEALNGSAFNDTLRGNGVDNTLNGNNGNDVLEGRAGNDTLNGSGGIDIARFSGNRADYTFAPNTVTGADGTDTHTGVELLRFDDAYVLGFGMSPINLVGFGLDAGVAIFGRNGAADQLTMDTNASFRLIDLGGMGGTLTLQTFGAVDYHLNLANVDTLLSTGGNDLVELFNAANGMTIDLGTGFDMLDLANGPNNVVTVHNLEMINGSTGDDTVTFVAETGVVNQMISLSTGTNTLILEGDEGNLNLDVSGANLTIIGQTSPVTGGNETLTLIGPALNGATIDLAAGADDQLFLSVGSNDVTVSGVEEVFGQMQFDTIRIDNALGSTTVTAGFGSDWIVAGGSFDQIRFTSVQDSYNDAATRDIVEDFETVEDTFLFDGIGGFVSNISYIDAAAFSGGGDNSEARLTDLGGGFELIVIDVDGDAVIGANDMTIELFNRNGALFDGNFVVV
ncbi:MAG: hypothetical protein ACRECO_00620 [Xanthobacteraceae bacterium]